MNALNLRISNLTRTLKKACVHLMLPVFVSTVAFSQNACTKEVQADNFDENQGAANGLPCGTAQINGTNFFEIFKGTVLENPIWKLHCSGDFETSRVFSYDQLYAADLSNAPVCYHVSECTSYVFHGNAFDFNIYSAAHNPGFKADPNAKEYVDGLGTCYPSGDPSVAGQVTLPDGSRQDIYKSPFACYQNQSIERVVLVTVVTTIAVVGAAAAVHAVVAYVGSSVLIKLTAEGIASIPVIRTVIEESQSALAQVSTTLTPEVMAGYSRLQILGQQFVPRVVNVSQNLVNVRLQQLAGSAVDPNLINSIRDARPAIQAWLNLTVVSSSDAERTAAINVWHLTERILGGN